MGIQHQSIRVNNVSTAAKVKKALKEKSNPEKAAFFPRFFKSGKGEYGEGDKFFGVIVPDQRKIAKQFVGLPDKEIAKLIIDPVHECRLTAIFILVYRFKKEDEAAQEKTVEFYLNNLDGVNNWDLVDSSAEKILGAFLENRDRQILYEFAETDHLWKQRIAMIATLHFIRNDDFGDTIAIAKLLLDHQHDLIHKAVGWMLREMGKRNEKLLKSFLKEHYQTMPRTMLRYAIEKFPKETRQKYLAGKVWVPA